MEKNCTNDYCVSNEEYQQMITENLRPTVLEWSLISAYFIVFLVGLGGNLWVCFVLCQRKSSKTTRTCNVFIINISVISLIMFLILLGPNMLVDITETWLLDIIGCKFIGFTKIACSGSYVLTLLCGSFVRQQAAERNGGPRFSRASANVCVVVSWVTAIAFAAPQLSSLTTIPRFDDTVLLTACRSVWPWLSVAIYDCVVIVALFILPGIITIGVYISSPTLTHNTQIDGYEERSTVMNDTKLFLPLILVFLVFNIPIQGFKIIRHAGIIGPGNWMHIMSQIFNLLQYVPPCINPCIYAVIDRRFRPSC